MAVRPQRTTRKGNQQSTASKPRLAAGDHGKSLDRLIHEKTRLAIVSALAANRHLTFNDLKSLLKISDGNLSAHTRKLEAAGYIDCTKDFDGRKPRTSYALTAAGRRALKKYISHMEALIKSVKSN